MPFSVKSSSSWRKSEADRILTLANWNDATNFDTVYVHKIEGTYSISGTFKPAYEYKLIELSKLALFIPIYFSIKGTITIPYTSNTGGYVEYIAISGIIDQYIERIPIFSSLATLGNESGDISIDICLSSECNYVNAVNAVVRYFHNFFNAQHISFVKYVIIGVSAYYNYPNYTQLDRVDANITGKLAAIAVTESDGLSITEYSTPTPYGLPGMAMMSAPLAASAGVGPAVRGPPGWGNTLPSGSQKPLGAKP